MKRATKAAPVPARPSLKARLARGDCLDAVWLSLGSVAIAEMAARAEPGVVVIDMQHGLWDRLSLEAAVGLASRAAPVLVRLADHSPVSISHALDAGAEGVLAPLVETAAQAAAIVSAARFPPAGTRSGGGVRPLTDFPSYVNEAAQTTLVGVMIETRAGLDQAAQIAAVPGVDLVFIGSGDLSLSLGEFPTPGAGHAAACERILQTCEASSVACGVFTGSLDAAKRMRDKRYRMVVIANDIELVGAGVKRATAQFHDGAKHG